MQHLDAIQTQTSNIHSLREASQRAREWWRGGMQGLGSAGETWWNYSIRGLGSAGITWWK
jgi:hypothetical protein